jgi:toxin ParE1/3/4
VAARLRISPQARADIRRILIWSEEHFGRDAALRYEELMIQALRDLEANPVRAGVRQRPDLPTGMLSYHLVASRNRVAGARVSSPRHLVLFRQSAEGVFEVVRILHDSRDLARHLPGR